MLMSSTDTDRHQHERLRTIMTSLLLGLLIAVFLYSFLGKRVQQREQKRYRDDRLIISKLVRLYNDPQSTDIEVKYRKLLADRADIVCANPTNRGAELIYHLFSIPSREVSLDADHDGRPEAYDEWGDPLILLTPELDHDELLTPEGIEQGVDLPPYCQSGFYINSIRFHSWLPKDEEALHEEQHGSHNNTATLPTTKPVKAR